ncbi:VCBS repeat-containing protein [Hymenobacter sp. BT523]|uniref:FG-GAP-like repeat-containing protein n=1 Tax=Hymenobacter sp. BT523 TaxID=2795725 RepID=UPI0018EDF58A|nr:FG-GAP-like repeat-containing protein [Hymenobacter sp. BT523]MBJ6107847.1 VCBS repeat-containing protein [Hymenobacter sp. BT523]
MATLLAGRALGHGAPGPAGAPPALASILNPDGTVKAGARGSFRAEGLRLSTTADGRPAFRPMAPRGALGPGDNNWSDAFGVNGVTGQVLALAADGSGNLYVGGNFRGAGNVVANGIAKWNGTAWSAVGGSLAGTSGQVSALAFDGSGNLYAGGTFTSIGGVSVHGIAYWNGSNWADVGGGMRFNTGEGSVAALAFDTNGNLYAGGRFTSAGGVTTNGGIARWDGSAWTALGTGIGGGTVSALAAGSAGTLYVGGSFTTAGGVAVQNVARWSGTAWSALVISTIRGVGGTVRAIAVLGSNVIVGGSLLDSSGSFCTLIRWTGTTWSTMQSTTSTSEGVYSLRNDGSGNLYVGGDYAAYGGTSGSTVAKLNSSLAWSSITTGSKGTVSALAVNSSVLYAGGQLQVIGNAAVSNVAKYTFSLSSWAQLGTLAPAGGMGSSVSAVAVNASGTVYAGGTFLRAGDTPANYIASWNGSTWSALGTGLNGNVNAVAVDGSGNVYAGGDFTTAGGAAASRIAKWNGTAWSALGSGLNGNVQALAVSSTGILYVGGTFSDAGGVAVTNVARWDGTAWSAMGTGLGFSGVFSLAVDGTGNVYAGGAFTSAGSTTVNGIARWDGSAWTALGGGGLGSFGQAQALAVDPSGALYVGGNFGSAGGVTAANIAKWNGTTWSALTSGTDQPVRMLAVDGSGNVYAGGDFTTAGGAAASRIAKWDGTAWSALGSGLSGSVTAAALDGSTALYAGGNFIAVGDGSKITMNLGRYTLAAPQPVLTGISPSSGPVGTLLTLTGTNLSATVITFAGTSNNTVTTGFTINPARTQITNVAVPAGATTGSVTVTTAAGTSNGVLFTLTAPLALTSTTPAANARAATATGPVSASFDRPMDAASTAALKVFSAQRGGQRAGRSGSSTVSTNTVSFAPSFSFRPGEAVQATVTRGATAAAGGTLPTPRVWQFTAAVSGGVGLFNGGLDPNLGNQPSGVAMGDMDGDGDLDLVVASNYAAGSSNPAFATLGVRRNDGNGVFSNGSDNSAGLSPQSVVLADVDGDGDLDVLAASSTSTGTVTVLLNDGSGTLTNAPSVNVGSSPQGVALGDVDGDGDLDLLAANSGSNTVSVRFNNGSGTFGGGSNVAVANAPTCVALNDVDGDGDLDLLTAGNGTSGTISVRLNAGDGTFGGSTQAAVGNSPLGLALGDVDGDGDADVLTANYTANTVSVRLNSGGVLGGTQEVNVGDHPRSVALSDVDGDGDLDLLTANEFASTVSVRLNNGSGVFAGGTDYGVGNFSNTVALGDVDGDGDVDVVTSNGTNTSTTTVSVRFNQAPPVLTALTPASGPIGSTITIAGTNLNNALSVSFNGTVVAPAAFVSSSATQLVVNVPTGTTTGNVTVTTRGGVSNGLLFTVTVAQLLVSQGSTNYPSAGTAYGFAGQVVGTTSPAVTFTLNNPGGAPLLISNITGTGDFALSGAYPTSVAAGATGTFDATFTPAGLGARTGTMVISSNIGTYTLNLTGAGLQPVPTLSSINPASGYAGSVVSLAGVALDNASAITFTGPGGSLATTSGYVVNAAGTQISGVRVPAGVAVGSATVTVTTPGGTSAGVPLTVTLPPPVVSGFGPSTGPVGTSVTLVGQYFNAASVITFTGSSGNTVSSGFVVNSAGTQITGVVVPAGALSGPISVTTPIGTGKSAAVFTLIGSTSNFVYTGGPQTYTVPAGVTRLKVDAYGASSAGSSYGLGGWVKATIKVVPGEVLTLVVGGKGTAGTDNVMGSVGQGGYNGGGNSGAVISGSCRAGVGGSGASDIRRVPNASVSNPFGGSTLANTLDRRLLVAGGAGGSDNLGGGSAGLPGGAIYYNPGVGGGAGTSGGGGAAGRGTRYTGTVSATAGSLGQGGTGANGVSTFTGCGRYTGHGGGGGYYGGGGGDGGVITKCGLSGGDYYYAGGGGGGASYVEPTALAAGTAPDYNYNTSGVDGSLTLTPVYAAPILTSFNPSSGNVGSTVALSGSDLTGVTAITFAGSGNNVVTSGFVVNAAGTGITGIVVPAGAVTGPVTVTTGSGASNSLNFSVGAFTPPAIGNFQPGNGTTGTSVVISGNQFSRPAAGGAGANKSATVSEVTFNGIPATFTVLSPSQVSAVVPPGATSGPIVVSNADGTAASEKPFVVNLNVTTGSALSPISVPAGSYGTITVSGAGTAELSGATTITNGLVVQSGGTLLTNCQPLTGPGDFTLADGATLRICDVDGLSLNASAGAVQVYGTRTFGPNARYEYGGSAAQVTGTGLPATVADVTIANAAGVTLTNPTTTISGTLTLASGGLTVPEGNALTIGSGATAITETRVIDGVGSFVLGDGAVLKTANLAGISALGNATGAVQTTTARTFDPGASYEYNGTAAQVTGSGLRDDVRNLTINNAAGVALTHDVTVNGALSMTSGVLTTGARTIALGTAGTLSEQEASYVLGKVTANRTLDPGVSESFGGLGLTLAAAAGSAAPGATLVARTTGTALLGAGTSQSILRYFDIQSAVNTGLNVAMDFKYFDHELNGIPTTNLALFRSVSGAKPWMPQRGTLAGPNLVTQTGITDFGVWTLGNSANPLPVELTSFTATAESPAAVRLAWATASEKNSAAFEVERSTDGFHFAAVGTVAAAGTSTSARHYAWLDAHLPAGVATLYYRLRQVDADGSASHSAVRTVALKGAAAGLAVFPNPAHAGATLTGARPGAVVTVFDALGRAVSAGTTDANGTAVLTLPEGLPSGVYVVRSGPQAVRLTVE